MPGPPRQTQLDAAPGSWRLTCAAPAADLAEVVQEYWEVEGRLGPFSERVVPNGFVELMVNLGPVHHLLTDRGWTAWRGEWVSGLQDRSLFIQSLGGTHLVSARLHALGARRVLRVAMSEVGNSVVDLHALVGPLAGRLRERLLAAGSPGARFALLERFVRQRLACAPPAHDLVSRAVALIDGAHGHIEISALCREARVSRKHLNALFADGVGLSPKAYARVQRFSWVVAELSRRADVDWSSLACAAGYADQSHLVRDFQRHAGASPTAFLRARTPDGSALLVETDAA